MRRRAYVLSQISLRQVRQRTRARVSKTLLPDMQEVEKEINKICSVCGGELEKARSMIAKNFICLKCRKIKQRKYKKHGTM